MKLELKSIKYMASLSEETSAFSANIWVNGKRAGYAKNGGFGGPTEVKITVPDLNSIALANARAWLDIVEPYPVDYSVNPERDEKTGRDVFARKSAEARNESTSAAYLEDLVDCLFSNYLKLKEVKKAQSIVSWRTTTCLGGEYVRINIKPTKLTTEQRLTISQGDGFSGWLFDKSIDDIATILNISDEYSGPLGVSVSL